jgi:hypothetical protein
VLQLLEQVQPLVPLLEQPEPLQLLEQEPLLEPQLLLVLLEHPEY